ncbi:transcriptional regulator [Pseudomonas sp. GD03858]|uniref:transcriptional regulator n=1 Tax=unclassified Pseudomonas TaxID=196821 RepID=UPI002447C84A|nr:MULTISPECIES: transcriptional regulator [unclassified Pseudomonas]MDH0645176.1 transcriptional regulator [Pseudomonas sp. GD03867]MDH0660798.1 transcriptional regulator [Pseudomonas sp. GD03858]
MLKKLTITLLVTLSLPVLASPQDIPSGKEVMRKNQAQIQNNFADVDYKRKKILETNMGLEGQENEKFWPIYNTYRAEADSLNKRTLEAMIDYGQAYSKGYVTDELATDLLHRFYSLQDDHVKLRERYTRRLAEKVSPKRALRFLQIETQLDAMVELDIARKLPLAE